MNGILDRSIRAFVSSTFRDMQAERGAVLPICLEEIRRCRPYFIGLLGERYGWIPEAIPPGVVEREPWLREHIEARRSVTELEILHGVLHIPAMTDHAFFYFRDPAFVESVPEDRRQDFTTEDSESAEKLRRLKSALLANWALRYRDQHPDDFVLLHFLGSSPDSASATGMLRRIMLELKQRFDLPDEIPGQPDQIREAFPVWLTNVAGRGRIVLMLDALNQLEDVDAAPELGWLPRVFPLSCRVIVSTLPGRSLQAIQRREWLNERIDWYLEAPDPRELYRKVIRRWEEACHFVSGGHVVCLQAGLLGQRRRSNEVRQKWRTESERCGNTNEQDRERFERLCQGLCVPSLYFRDYYGFPWPPEDELRHDFEASAGQRARRPRCREAWISRYEIEAFMQQKAVVPAKWMGARLGMTGASLDELLNRLKDQHDDSHRIVIG